jgi:hypothetical protein
VKATDPSAAKPAWSARVEFDPAFPSAVSCPISSLCVVVDFEGNALVTHDPTATIPTWTSSAIDPGHELRSVSCTAAMVCGAVDEAGRFLTTVEAAATTPSWSAPVAIDRGHALRSVSCAPATLCTAGDDFGQALAGTAPAPGPGPSPSPTTGGNPPKILTGPELVGPVPSCILKPQSSKILVAAGHHKHAHPGRLTLTARCTQTVLGVLTGKVTVGSAKKRRTYGLPATRRSLTLARTVTFAITLPAKAIAALAHGAHETATFKLAFTSANGPGSVAAKIATLKPQR